MESGRATAADRVEATQHDAGHFGAPRNLAVRLRSVQGQSLFVVGYDRVSPAVRQGVVAGDRILLEQVLHNLLPDATPYHAEGPAVRVEVTAARPDPTTVEIRVHDAGIGIPEPDGTGC